MSCCSVADLLVAIAYGDALGLPREGAKFNPRGGVLRLEVDGGTYLGPIAKGQWSDDTQLSLAVAVALAEKGEFDLEEIADCHAKAWELVLGRADTHSLLAPAFIANLYRNGDGGLRSGWGRATRTAVQRILEGVPPTESGDNGSLGNGVIMKMAPLVHFQIMSNSPIEELDRQVGQLTRMTHNNDWSVAHALAYARILWSLHEKSLDETNRNKPVADWGVDWGEITGYDTEQRLINGTRSSRGFIASQTLEVARYYFERWPWFPENVQMATRYGGDSDTICAVLAAMSVFAGTYALPSDVREVHDYWRLVYAGESLDRVIGGLLLKKVHADIAREQSRRYELAMRGNGGGRDYDSYD